MDTCHIRFAVDGNLATITLDRPDVLNAYQPEMGDELVDAFAAALGDDDVRAVILTGNGRAFCSGVDLKFMKEQAARIANGETLRPIGQEAFVSTFPAELARYPKPVIVAFNGPAIGVGVTMSLPCDIRIAAEEARFGVTFTKLGMLPGLGSTHLLPKIVGLGNALDLVLTARVIDAHEAAAIGLVQRVVPGDRLLSVARETAEWTAACDPAALAAAKGAFHFGAASTLEQAMANERTQGAALRARRKST